VHQSLPFAESCAKTQVASRLPSEESNGVASFPTLAHIAIDSEGKRFHSVPFIFPNPKPFPLPQTYLFRDFNCFLDVLEINVLPPKKENEND
jgi:hypothetical protein